MTIYKLFILICFILISSCFSPVQTNINQLEFKKLEILQQITIHKNKINFQAASTGCTKNDDFLLHHQINNQTCQISIFRIKPDLCKRSVKFVNLSLPWEKDTTCGTSKIKTVNPIENNSPATF